ncbi:MAG: cytochrome c [bacterium]|nr:cytochrome c [bacterium]
MKRVFLFAAIFIVSSAASLFAMDHAAMHAEDTADKRRELKLPAPMKVKQKAMMRSHLDTLSDITLALAENRLDSAASIARGLGWSAEEERKCSSVSDMTGEADFLTLGKALHKKADALAAAAASGSRDKALILLSELITNCNACHYKFRH